MLFFVLDEKVLRLIWIFGFVDNTVAFRTQLFCFYIIISYQIAVFRRALSFETCVFVCSKLSYFQLCNQITNYVILLTVTYYHDDIILNNPGSLSSKSFINLNNLTSCSECS